MKTFIFCQFKPQIAFDQFFNCYQFYCLININFCNGVNEIFTGCQHSLYALRLYARVQLVTFENMACNYGSKSPSKLLTNREVPPAFILHR